MCGQPVSRNQGRRSRWLKVKPGTCRKLSGVRVFGSFGRDADLKWQVAWGTHGSLDAGRLPAIAAPQNEGAAASSRAMIVLVQSRQPLATRRALPGMAWAERAAGAASAAAAVVGRAPGLAATAAPAARRRWVIRSLSGNARALCPTFRYDVIRNGTPEASWRHAPTAMAGAVHLISRPLGTSGSAR